MSFGRRRKKEFATENYYKVLGTTANAGQSKIKEQYIKKVKEFPPETHPGEFQTIREAYDTLKDPKKRKKYDIMRKYGSRIEKLLEDASFQVIIGQLNKAQKLLDQVIKIDPSIHLCYFLKAEIFISQENIKEFHKVFEEALLHTENDLDLKEDIIEAKIELLLKHDYPDLAKEELEKYKDSIISRKLYLKLSTFMYIDIHDFDNAYNFILEQIPTIEQTTIDDLDLFIMWLNLCFMLDKRNELSKVESRFKKLLRNLTVEDTDYAFSELIYGYDMNYEICRFGLAELFLRLAAYINPKDPYVLESKAEIKELAVLESELRRYKKDFKSCSRILMEVSKHFYEEIDYMHMDSFLDVYRDTVKYDEHSNEDMVECFLYFKKKYKLLYKEYQEEMDEFIEDYMGGLNREMRRRLR